MSFHKIKNVEALDNFTLQVLFESGEKRFYDLNKLIEVNKDFEILKRDKNLFKLVKIDIQGYGIYWNDYLDLLCKKRLPTMLGVTDLHSNMVRYILQ